MSRWARAVAAVAALVFVPAAAGGNPVPALYNDYASDGVLNCHSKADLHAVLADATLQQYGDPSTMIGLKLAARKQLAGGCRHSAQTSSPVGSSESPASRQRSQETRSNKAKNSPNERSRTSAAPPPTRASAVEESTDERMLLGSGLLLLTLATGGWAARRAFNNKR
jgi:hypothetical protein